METSQKGYEDVQCNCCYSASCNATCWYCLLHSIAKVERRRDCNLLLLLAMNDTLSGDFTGIVNESNTIKNNVVQCGLFLHL